MGNGGYLSRPLVSISLSMRAQIGIWRDSCLYIGGVCGVECVIGTPFRCWIGFGCLGLLKGICV